MPTINPSLVPSVAPGNLFSTLTQDDTLNVRWLTATDPVFYESLNRPLADMTLRQLILAKTLDQLSLSIGHQAMFPFVVQAQVVAGTEEVDVPDGWIWDLHLSAPAKWENWRLAKIKRLSGGTTTSGHDGTMRLIFTASQSGSTVEAAVFSADYEIDSTLTYQRARLTIVNSAEEALPIASGETETVEGFITFRTLDQTDPIVDTFYTGLAPPTGQTDADNDGYYDSPSTYHLANTVPGGTGVSWDFSLVGVIHGTGLLVDSVYNTIPSVDSDIQSWINSFNYPFDASATRTSTAESNVTIPSGLFQEFDITAPAGDEPTGSTVGTFFPVWVSRIQLIGTANDQLRVFFATHSVSDASPSLDAIEFARLDLQVDMVSGTIVEISPIDDLRLHVGTDDSLYQQHFGRGHVVLSSVWSPTVTTISDFFNDFSLLPTGIAEFAQSSTRLSSFGISRVPKYTPSIGESQALQGTTSSLDTPIPPSSTNKYVAELDQGMGNRIDLESDPDITPTDGIERYGYTGALAHRIIYLCIDNTQVPTGSESGATTFYDTEVLPRLRLILGRSPQFGDFWHNGTELFFFNGNTWQS